MSYARDLDAPLPYERGYERAHDQALERLPELVAQWMEGKDFADAVAEELARLYKQANDPSEPANYRRLLPGKLIAMIDERLDRHADEEASQA